jgi:hypothetical protein
VTVTDTLVRRAVLAAALVAAAAGTASARSVVVGANGTDDAYDCGGENATISGNSNTVTLTHCDGVRVMGNRNHVNANDVRTITVYGSENEIEWHADQEPRVSNRGRGNHIHEMVRAGKEGVPEVGVGKEDEEVGKSGVGRSSSRRRSHDFVLRENGDNATHDCAGGEATVNGDGNTYRFRDCYRVVVNGDGNTIDAGSVERLDVRGSGNTVSWRGDRPRIRDEGHGNTIAGR